jgi:hypothetical protein
MGQKKMGRTATFYGLQEATFIKHSALYSSILWLTGSYFY